MIFVAGVMMLNPAKVDAFEADVAAMIDDVRGEDGCLHYSLVVEDKAAGRINVHEQWRDDEALVAHFGQSHIQDFFAQHSPELRDTTVQIYDIDGEPRPLPGI